MLLLIMLLDKLSVILFISLYMVSNGLFLSRYALVLYKC